MNHSESLSTNEATNTADRRQSYRDNLANNMRRAMTAHGVTVADVALRSGVPRDRVECALDATDPVDLNELAAICDAVGVHAEAAVLEEEDAELHAQADAVIVKIIDDHGGDVDAASEHMKRHVYEASKEAAK